jgi:hypothetical protein
MRVHIGLEISTTGTWYLLRTKVDGRQVGFPLTLNESDEASCEQRLRDAHLIGALDHLVPEKPRLGEIFAWTLDYWFPPGMPS